jgi:hypothetical protein
MAGRLIRAKGPAVSRFAGGAGLRSGQFLVGLSFREARHELQAKECDHSTV